MNIREMCDRFGVTPRTLRFYEARELLSPIRRGQHRLYNRADRGRLTLILRGKRFGFSLEEIRELLELYEPGKNMAQLSAAIQIGRERLIALERQRQDLGIAIKDLRGQLDLIEEKLATETAKTETAKTETAKFESPAHGELK
ncbi:MerR family transcriptional regulator [Paracoccus pacificus]|uniref:MerR family transcriptional regulator n=1 Tax=Paracoccus pacificus TaxID=1463598 RepID=A0ABW4RD51_9RHOB